MKYVVIYNLDSVKSALSFDSHNDAVDTLTRVLIMLATI